jgi:hypothetical protein
MSNSPADTVLPASLALTAASLLALAAAVFLWVHYGPVVFFETLRAGFAACFG